MEVTPEAIEAGLEALSRNGSIAEAYLAMKAKEPASDEVERVALAICDEVDERSCFASTADIVRCYGPHARAAIASMGDDGLREALTNAAIQLRHYNYCHKHLESTDTLLQEIDAALARTSLGTDGGEL